MTRHVLRLAISLLLATAAFAHDSEPINTDFASPLAPGSANLQLGVNYFHGATDAYDLAPMTLEYGLHRRMQFSVTFPLTRLDQPGKTYVRPGNLEVEGRYLLAGGNERKFALSLNPGLSLPSGDKRVSENTWVAGGALHLDTHLAERFWTHANLGYETPIAGFREKEKNLVYRFAAMYEATERIQPVLELVGEHDFQGGQGRLALVPEAIFTLSHRIQLKAGLPLGLTRSTPDVGAQFQLTWKFGKHEGRQ